jgi:adenine-specific DNA-methyltransferase
LIIGNPPFYILKGTKTNIFVEIVKKCILDHLHDNGTLAFVLPKSIMNSYPECRQTIINNLDLVHVQDFNDSSFMGTQQPVLILIGKKTCPSKRFVFQDQYISQEYLRLSELYTVSLKSLGCSVKTGDVVWNQEKKNLRDDQGSLIFYSENIGSNHSFVPMVTKNTEKKQYIIDRTKPVVTGPAFIVARGYGTGSYKFKWAFVDSSVSFYGENHVNILKVPPQHVDRIKEAFETRIPEFLRCFLGNGALSKSELEILPI